MKYIVSLTSCPSRITATLPRVLNDLNEKLNNVKIIVSIPVEYKKGWKLDRNSLEFLKEFKNVELNIIKKDWGPGTKLIGGIQWLKKNNDIEVDGIITFDDDILFERLDLQIQNLLSNAEKRPNQIITTGGLRLIHEPYKSGNGISPVYDTYSNSVAGYMGVFYPKSFWESDLVFNLIDELDDNFYSEDDAYFGAVAAKLNIPIWSTGFVTRYMMIDESSMVEFGHTVHREIRESQLYRQLIEDKIIKI